MPHFRVEFRKGEEARFLSHLDLQATLEYAIRRARLPIELSQGFNPRPRLSLAAPLAVGHVGEHEILEIALREPLLTEDIRARLQAALPVGIAVLSVREIPVGQKSAASRLRSATYRIDMPLPIEEASTRIAELLSRQALDVEEPHKDSVRKRNIRPLILSIEATGRNELRLSVQLDAAGTVRPEQVLAFLSISGDGCRITRESIELND